MEKAVSVLDKKAKKEEIGEQWITTFLDLCKNIGEESMQYICAKNTSWRK